MNIIKRKLRALKKKKSQIKTWGLNLVAFVASSTWTSVIGNYGLLLFAFSVVVLLIGHRKAVFSWLSDVDGKSGDNADDHGKPPNV